MVSSSASGSKSKTFQLFNRLLSQESVQIVQRPEEGLAEVLLEAPSAHHHKEDTEKCQD